MKEEYRGVPDERDLQLSKVLSAGAIKALQEAEINTVDELVSFTKAELLALDGIGENSVKTIEKVLAEHKLKLATEKAE
jgi:DNA-directed RNA polymerase alpha subunit